MPQAVERLAFEDGSWWDIMQEMSYGASRRVTRAVTQKLAMPIADLQAGFDPTTLSGAQGGEIVEARNQAWLLYCTVGWSWPEPVTEVTLDTRPERVVSRVVARMAELYQDERSAEAQAALKKG